MLGLYLGNFETTSFVDKSLNILTKSINSKPLNTFVSLFKFKSSHFGKPLPPLDVGCAESANTLLDVLNSFLNFVASVTTFVLSLLEANTAVVLPFSSLNIKTPLSVPL